jgi:preprotein translocase subunit SecY
LSHQRRHLDRAAIVGVAVALLQAYFMSAYIRGAAQDLSIAPTSTLLIMVSLAAGSVFVHTLHVL